jgi:hypothetical protein
MNMHEQIKEYMATQPEPKRSDLHAHLALSADGYVCTTDDLLNVLLGIATNRGTLEAVCRDCTL